MNTSTQHVYLTPALLAVATLVGWILVRLAVGSLRGRLLKWLVAPLSLLVAWGFWSSLLAVVSTAVETAGTWPEWILALMAAVASEAVLSLYVDHRGSRSRWTRWVPVSLRLVLIGFMTCILLEPIVTHCDERVKERHVAVLLDASASMNLCDVGIGEDRGDTRRAISRRLLLETPAGGKPLLDQLQGDYDVRLYEFAATPHEVPLADWRETGVVRTQPDGDDVKNPWAQCTNTAAAIGQVDEDLPRNELSGVILITDGCDHSPTDGNMPYDAAGESLRQSAHRLVRRQVPIHSVLVGNRTPISDAAVVAVNVPQQVFCGDRVAIRAPIKVDGFANQSVQVRLIKDGQGIEERMLSIPNDRYRETIVFQHLPEQAGLHEYSVEMDPLPGERIEENNRQSARVWVSKDSIRLLIVDQRPRWEFRYLRNLFAGRDRSVFMQYVLLQPDRLSGVPDPPVMYASVTRAFDDCQATALPQNESEWLKFDVIVLGDVDPGDLGSDAMHTLEKFVKHCGGTLVLISGRQYMPHAYSGTPLAAAMPVQLADSPGSGAVSPDVEYSLRVAAGAESSPIMQLSTGPDETDSIWGSLPPLHWRHPTCRAKAGATVLAYAGVAHGAEGTTQQQRERALILWHRFGIGKVAQLAFDQTWRLRYGTGDRYHHRFWGQVLRWAAQDQLMAGTERVRFGTDQAIYRAGQTVIVRARLLDSRRNPIESRDTRISIFLDDRLVGQTALIPQPDSGGMLSATIDNLDRPGKYSMELTGPTVDRLLREEGRAGQRVLSELAVEGAEPTTEMSDHVADATAPSQLADWSGGIITTPDNAAELLNHLGPKSTFHREQWTVPLWNLWPVLILFLLIVNTEWIVRRTTGLV